MREKYKIITLKLQEDEFRILNESLKSGINSIAWTIIARAYKKKRINCLSDTKQLNKQEVKK